MNRCVQRREKHGRRLTGVQGDSQHVHVPGDAEQPGMDRGVDQGAQRFNRRKGRRQRRFGRVHREADRERIARSPVGIAVQEVTYQVAELGRPAGQGERIVAFEDVVERHRQRVGGRVVIERVRVPSIATPGQRHVLWPQPFRCQRLVERHDPGEQPRIHGAAIEDRGVDDNRPRRVELESRLERLQGRSGDGRQATRRQGHLVQPVVGCGRCDVELKRPGIEQGHRIGRQHRAVRQRDLQVRRLRGRQQDAFGQIDAERRGESSETLAICRIGTPHVEGLRAGGAVDAHRVSPRSRRRRDQHTVGSRRGGLVFQQRIVAVSRSAAVAAD